VMVLPRGIHKGSGLLEALGELKIDPQHVIAIGDAENDFHLLGACGYGVAVANALPALAQRAHMVTLSPRGRGVLELIERLLVTDPTRSTCNVT
jgi:hydroxymethylpyrimidine pyrophosphatase-like HAD family hydrolase